MAKTYKFDALFTATLWSDRMGQAGSKIKAGVMATTEAPGQAAGRAKARYLQGVQNAVDRWATNVARVTLQQWQEAMLTKGLPRIASGAQAAVSKQAAFYERFFPKLQSILASMPARGTFDQNMTRSRHVAEGLMKLKGTFKGQ